MLCVGVVLECSVCVYIAVCTYLPVCLLVAVSQWMINPPSILVVAAQRQFSSFVLLPTTNCTGGRCDAAAAISLPKTACMYWTIHDTRLRQDILSKCVCWKSKKWITNLSRL